MSRRSRTPEVALVTDSSVCLPPALLQRHRITVVPLAFLFDGELYHDGDFSSGEFYRRLEAARRPPSTTSAAPGEFLAAFHRALEAGAQRVLCLTLNSRFSGTYSAAVHAAELAARERPALDVRVADTGGLALTHGFAVLAAARALERGAALEEAAAAAQAVGGGAYLAGFLDTTRYLAKSGRVPWILHWAASLLHIKPVLAAHRGDVRAIGRSRTEAQAMNKLLAYVAGRARPGAGLQLGVMHAEAEARAHRLAARLKERFGVDEVMVCELTSVMGVHTGPGFVGVAFYGPPPAAPAAERQKTRYDYVREHDARLLEEALGPLPQASGPLALVLLTGLPGTGKSHLARELARRHPFVIVESDALRKALFKQPKHTDKEHLRLFAAVHVLIGQLLARGLSVIFDATSLKEEHRQPVYEIAERREARLIVVQTVAPERLARQRLARRQRQTERLDASEAGPDVYDKMRDEAEPIGCAHIVVDTSQGTGPALDNILRDLQAIKV